MLENRNKIAQVHEVAAGAPLSLGWVIVGVGSEQFALPLEEVREVVRACWPRRVPRAPFGCLGALSLRGERVLMLDLGATLGLRRPPRVEAEPEKIVDSHLVVLDQQPPLALLVDRVAEVAEGEKAESVVVLHGKTLLNPRRRELLARAAERAGAVS